MLHTSFSRFPFLERTPLCTLLIRLFPSILDCTCLHICALRLVFSLDVQILRDDPCFGDHHQPSGMN